MFGNSNHVSLAICTGQKHILKFEGMSFGDGFRRFIAAQSECGMWNKSLKFWSGISTVLTQSDNQDTPSHILIPRGLIRQKSSRNNKSCSNLIILLFQSGQDNMHSLLWKVKAHHSATVMAWRFIFRLWTNVGLFKFLTKCKNNNCDATLILHLFLNNDFVFYSFTLILFLDLHIRLRRCDATTANIKLYPSVHCWLSVVCIVTLH